MKKLIVATLLSAVTAVAFAQAGGQSAPGSGQATSGGVNIQGNTNINAVAGKQTAVAVGKGNKAENAVGQIGGN